MTDPHAIPGIFFFAVLAGLVGSMLGLGGGIIIIPALTLLYGIDMRAAAATSLLCVVATSAAGTSSYLRKGLTDLRLGLLMEMPTVIGAIAGGVIAFHVQTSWLKALFSMLLLYTAWAMWRDSRRKATVASDAESESEAAGLVLDGSYTDPITGAKKAYRVRHIEWGMLASTGAGVVSGMLGVGGGIIKVPVMRLKMGVPMKVATATSNFMIGITAATSVMLYFRHGQVQLPVTAVCALGILLGATTGARIATRLNTRWLQRLFVVILLFTAMQMLWTAWHGGGH